jgi:hypothetical protein
LARSPSFSPAASERNIGTSSKAARVADDEAEPTCELSRSTAYMSVADNKQDSGEDCPVTPSSSFRVSTSAEAGEHKSSPKSSLKSSPLSKCANMGGESKRLLSVDPALSFESSNGSPSTPEMKARRGIDEDIIRLYFDIFDVDEDGYIQMEDLRLVAQNLLVESREDKVDRDGSIDGMPLSPMVRDLFGVMDTDHNRMIDYLEFKSFFLSLSEHPMLRRM